MRKLVDMDEEDVYRYNKLIIAKNQYNSNEIEIEEYNKINYNFWHEYLMKKYGALRNIPLTIDINNKTISTFNNQIELFS